MKTMKFMLFAVAAMAAAACAKEVAPEVSAPAEVNYVEMEFSSALETTKTVLNGSSVSWVGSATLSSLDNSASPANTKATTVSGLPGTFAATVPEATEYYAAYPYRANVTLSGSKLTNWYLAQVQTPYKGSFDYTRAPMIAKADANNVLAFKNIASHVRVTIPADMTDVMAITLMGNEDELITGIYDVEWNNGDPTYSFPNLSQGYPYVTLRKGDKTPIAPGEYYFTILPVEFKKGFTLIFAKTDGTQVAVRTDKPVTTVSKRNQIQPMKEAPSSAFKSHMNYFVHYDNGFDLDISGFVINSAWAETNNKKAIIVTDTKENGTINTSSSYLYFISPNCKTANFGGKTVNDMLIIGADGSVRSDLTLTGHTSIAIDGSYYILSNVNVKNVNKDALPLRADAGKFGYVIMNNCRYATSYTYTFDLDLGSTDVNSSDIESFIIEDCDFIYNTTTATYLVRDYRLTSEYGLVKVHNNTFSGNVGSFRMLNIGNSGTVGSTVDRIFVTNNTFVGFAWNSYVLSARNITSHCEIARNLFIVQGNLKLISSPGMSGTLEGGGVRPKTETFVDNYYYNVTDAEITSTHGWKNKPNPLPLSSDPLSDLWDPANGKFGAYTIVPAEGAAAPTGLVGAQRPDMDPVTAAVNSAAYGYETNDLGKL